MDNNFLFNSGELFQWSDLSFEPGPGPGPDLDQNDIVLSPDFDFNVEHSQNDAEPWSSHGSRHATFPTGFVVDSGLVTELDVAALDIDILDNQAPGDINFLETSTEVEVDGLRQSRPRPRLPETDQAQLQILLRKDKLHFRPLLLAFLSRAELDQALCDATDPNTAIERALSNREKALLYIATNNLTGFADKISPTLLFDFLKQYTNEIFQPTESRTGPDFARLNEQHTLKPKAEAFFRAAIEIGDHTVVRALLSLTQAGINVNTQVCTEKSTRYTPIERSAALGHYSLTKTLLEFSADCNQTHDLKSRGSQGTACGCIGGGALKAAFGNNTAYDIQSADRKLLELIIRHGGLICSRTLKVLISEGRHDLIEILLSDSVPKHCTSWLDAGVYHEAAHRLDSASLPHLLLIMARSSVAYTAPYVHPIANSQTRSRTSLYVFHRSPYPTTVLDILAERGELESVSHIRSSGVSFTVDSLVAAIRSGCKKLVQFMLDQGADLHNYSPHYLSTPYAECIRTRNDALLEIIQPSFDSHNDFKSCAALAAASEVGNMCIVDSLLAGQQCTDDRVLGYALTKAVQSNSQDIALKLLEAGASSSERRYCDVLGCSTPEWSIAVETVEMNPLRHALIHRNKAMFYALLDHSDLNQLDLMGFPSAPQLSNVSLAVKWGDLAVVKEFIDLACGLGEAVAIAVKTKNSNALHLLLGAGAPINRGLQVAVEEGNLGMLDELLRCGADPLEHEHALIEALDQPPEIVSRLLKGCSMQGVSKTCVSLRFLCAAVEKDRVDVVRLLVNGTYSFKAECLCPLKASVARYSKSGLEVMKLLLGFGFNTNRVQRSYGGRGYYHSTALLDAVGIARKDVIELLIEYGADVNLPAPRGIKRTPLQRAVEIGNREIVEYLLLKGADVNAVASTRGGATCLQLASIGGYIGIFELLTDNGGIYLAPSAIVHGRTPLEGAAEHGRYSMVEYLLKKFGLRKLAEYTRAKQFATDNGHHAVVSLLDSVPGEHLEHSDSCDLQVWNGSDVTYTCNAALLGARDRPRLAPNRFLGLCHHQPVPQSTSNVIADVLDKNSGADGAMLDNIHHYDISSTISSVTRIAKRPHIHSECEEVTTSDSTSKRQKRKHQVTCEAAGCGKSYPRLDRLKRHQNTAHANSKFPCGLCEKTYGRKDTLAEHVTSKHKNKSAIYCQVGIDDL